MAGPRVTNGTLSEPYPIKSRGDVNRARVLPPPAVDRSAGKAIEKKAPPKAAVDESATDERAKGGFDYVMRRNKMLKGIRGPARRSARSRNA